MKTARLPLVRGKPRLGCPLAGIGKMVCIGLNYTDHAEEVGMALPKEPTVFIKAPSALCGPDDPTVRPRGGTKLDYECELAAVIGRDARNVDEGKALGHVAAYCIVNDVSERAFQMEHGGTTTKGKSADSFGPVGPWLVTADEIRDPQALELWTTVNGERRQHGTTAKMIFTVASLVAYVSRFMSLRAGRPDLHRHAGRRRPRLQAAALPAAGRRRGARHQWSRRAAPSHRGGEMTDGDGRTLASHQPPVIDYPVQPIPSAVSGAASVPASEVRRSASGS